MSDRFAWWDSEGFAAVRLIILVLLLVPFLGYITSSSTSQGNVSAIVGIPCNIQLGQGWNYISICAQPANTSIASVLQGIDYRYVMLWNASSQKFDIFSPKAANPPFNSFDTNKSYFILYSNATPATLDVIGNLSGDENISLVQGWNPPAWPYIFTSNISCYLQSITNKYNYVMKWNYTPQQFIIYSPRAAEPQFTTISRGEGQFISVIDPSGALLRYNKTFCEP